MGNGDLRLNSDETFELVLDTINGSFVSADELVSILANSQKLLKSINHTLNKKYNIGYDVVDVDVLALESGSFKISCCLRKSVSDILVGTTVGVLSPLLLSVIQDNPAPVVYNINDSEVTITQDTLYENKETRKSVVEIAKTAVESENIRALSMKYERTDGVHEEIRIEKETLSNLSQMPIEDDIIRESYIRKSRLVITRPNLEAEDKKWGVRDESGHNFNATMCDEDFLEKMGTSNIAFGRGDVIVADVETIIQTNEGQRSSYSYMIRKVYEYPKYKKTEDAQLDLGN